MNIKENKQPFMGILVMIPMKIYQRHSGSPIDNH